MNPIEKLTAIVSILQDELVENQCISLKHFKKDKEGKDVPDFDLGINSGILGVVLFFLELYQENRKDIFLSIATNTLDEIIDFLEEMKEYTYHFGLMNGMGGTLYILYRMYRIKGDEDLLKKMVLFAKKCSYFIHSKEINNSFWEGKTGLLYVLLLIYKESRDVDIEEAIKAIFYYLLDDIHINEKGLFWRTDYLEDQSHYGLAYGSSGIRNIFLLLKQFVDTPCIELIERYSSSYENSHLQMEPTLSHPSKNISWKNGWIGLGIARILQASLEGGKLNEDPQIERIFERIYEGLQRVDTFSLLDACGIKILSHLCPKHFSSDHILFTEISQRVALLVSEKEKELSNRPKLLGYEEGLIGLGYYYLLTPERTASSLFAPKLLATSNCPSGNEGFSIPYVGKEELFRILSKKYFPYLNFLFLNKLKEVDMLRQKEAEASLSQQLISYVESLMSKKEDDPKCDMMEELYILEKRKFLLSITHDSFLEAYDHTYLFHQKSRELAHLPEAEILSFTYRITNGIERVESKFYWRDLILTNPKLDPPTMDTKYHTYLKKSYRYIGVDLYCLNSFEEILTLFETPLTGREVLDVLIENSNSSRAEFNKQLSSKLVDLILFGVQNGLIEIISNSDKDI